MGWIGLFLLASVAVAADAEECGGVECPAGWCHDEICDGPRLTPSVIKTLAEEFDVTDGEFEDLSSTSNLKDLIQWGLVPLHDMICQVRKEEAGCDTEWKEYLDDALDILSSIRASMVQLVVGGQRGTKKEQAHSISEKGQADENVVLLLKEHMRRYLMIIVKSGEEPASALQMASEVMQTLKNMDDSSLLAYAQDSKAKLAKRTSSLCSAMPACLRRTHAQTFSKPWSGQPTSLLTGRPPCSRSSFAPRSPW